ATPVNRSNTCSSVTLGLPAYCSSWASPATAASASSHCMVPLRSPLDDWNSASAYGRAMVASSAMLQLGLQAVQEFGVDAGVHFLAQDLLGALDGQRGN